MAVGSGSALGEGRDWNDEFQAVKSMGKDSLDERIARDQAHYRLQVGFFFLFFFLLFFSL